MAPEVEALIQVLRELVAKTVENEIELIALRQLLARKNIVADDEFVEARKAVRVAREKMTSDARKLDTQALEELLRNFKGPKQ